MKKGLLAFFVLFLLFVSCTKKEGESFVFESASEREGVEKFLRHLLFWERGVYTLLGSKPITIFDIFEEDASIHPSFDTSLNPDVRFYFNKDSEEDLKFYNSLGARVKKNAVVLSDRDYILDGMTLMSKWEKFSSKYQISPNYLLIKVKYSEEEMKDLAPSCKEAYHVLFVNVLKTVCLLSDHRELFAKHLGDHFNPLEEVLKIGDPSSSIWECLFPADPTNLYQEIGLLLGYGKEDAQIFHLKNSQPKPDTTALLQKIYENSTDDLEQVFKKPYPLSSKNFPLPVFMSYSPLDPIRQKYENERKEIMEFYSNQDFLELTLGILTTSP
ncbi:MAG: hypothetical protein H7A38_01375 [Chlamydiales bacterium]|nr:hypothetical protein [Chlamydiales bacterium]